MLYATPPRGSVGRLFVVLCIFSRIMRKEIDLHFNFGTPIVYSPGTNNEQPFFVVVNPR